MFAGTASGGVGGALLAGDPAGNVTAVWGVFVGNGVGPDIYAAQRPPVSG
jgi:hypothetical protein